MTNHLDPRSKLSKQNPRLLNREVYYKGDIIVRQGDEGYRAYYIDAGHVEIVVEKDGHEVRVAELHDGDIFGEMSLITHDPRSATVRAIEATAVTIISRDEIEGKIEQIQDKALRALIEVLVERLKESNFGQLYHHKNLTEFQDRVTGIVDRAHVEIDDKKRDAFRAEVEPLLNDLQNVLDKYKYPGSKTKKH